MSSNFFGNKLVPASEAKVKSKLKVNSAAKKPSQIKKAGRGK